MYKVDSPIIFKQYVFQCSSVFIPNIYVYNCRLGKKLPTHTMSNYCSKLEIQDDDDDDDDRYEDIIQEYDDCSYSPELSQSYIAESKARTAMKENQEEELRKISQLPPPKSFLQKTPGLKPDVPTVRSRQILVDSEIIYPLFSKTKRAFFQIILCSPMNTIINIQILKPNK